MALKASSYPGRAVYIVDGARSPFLKAQENRGHLPLHHWRLRQGARYWRGNHLKRMLLMR